MVEWTFIRTARWSAPFREQAWQSSWTRKGPTLSLPPPTLPSAQCPKLTSTNSWVLTSNNCSRNTMCFRKADVWAQMVGFVATVMLSKCLLELLTVHLLYSCDVVHRRSQGIGQPSEISHWGRVSGQRCSYLTHQTEASCRR